MRARARVCVCLAGVHCKALQGLRGLAGYPMPRSIMASAQTPSTIQISSTWLETVTHKNNYAKDNSGEPIAPAVTTTNTMMQVPSSAADKYGHNTRHRKMVTTIVTLGFQDLISGFLRGLGP